MRRLAIAGWILVLLLFVSSASPSSPAAFQGRSCTLSIRNNSGRDFYRLHISWSGDKDWGPNLLSTPLRAGAAVDRVVAAAQYDVMLVDGNDHPCVARGVRVFNDTPLSITEGHCR